ncbi:MAG: hypothetical protein EPN22_09215 [Nitrospirae bacterium]|nr:MAG: hypothetical protein EPN22_09215 [Nitrospirota bacterium]
MSVIINTMEIQDLRSIGKKLFAGIGKTRLRPFESSSIGKGAGGDKTFPIDKQAEDIIISGLEMLDEPLSIVSEEAGIKEIKGGGSRVLIDPIDGSKNAISGVPFYCSSIAVADGNTVGSVFMSYVINLLTGDEFWAERGRGAYFNGNRMTTQQDDLFYFIAYEAQMPKRDIPAIINLLAEARRARCFGSMALDLAYLAYGSASVFVMPAPSRSFDYAGGWLLVKEAGGVITDTKGNSIDNAEAGLGRGATILASGNAKLHDKALKLL